MNNLPDNVSKYLKKNSSGNWKLETDNFTKINSAIIIPAVSEFDNIISLLISLSENDAQFFKNTIVVFVINNLKSSSIEIKENNLKSINLLRKIIYQRDSPGNSIIAKIINSKLRLGIIDASTNGNELSEKEGGVGLARKIGMDLALRFFDYSSNQKKLLICLDADCIVDKNYISEINRAFNLNNFSAAVISYKHKFDDEETAPAIICYEIFLRYYVLGLELANSPFAFHSIGSTIVCDHESYVKVGGINKRKAAEDFYFLEKLAKINKIQKVNSANVYPSSRASWRVPFGTGKSVSRFLSRSKNEYVLYNMKSFFILKEWLNIFNSKKILPADRYLEEAKKINLHLYKFLIQNNFKQSWEKIFLNSNSEKQINKQKINWFDGFKTLKLIHFLRGHAFSQINMFDALDEIFINFNISLNISREKNAVPSLENQKLYLETLRCLT